MAATVGPRVIGMPGAQPSADPARRPITNAALGCAVVLSFAVARIYSTVVIVWAAAHPATWTLLRANGWGLTHKFTLGTMTSSWDGHWFQVIAEHGYPAKLVVTQHGVRANAWAFMPLYPKTIKVILRLFGGNFTVIGSVLSLVAAALAVALLVPLLRPRIGTFGTFAVATLLAVFPASPVFQMTYSESFGMLAVVAVLLCLDRQKYLAASALIILAGVTRPVAIPLLAVVALLIGVRWFSRAEQPITRRERLAFMLLAASAIVAVIEWPLIAWFRTGTLGAYTLTESAWHHGHSLIPFQTWVTGFQAWFGPVLGIVVFLAFAGTILALVLSPLAARLGWQLRVWCIAYATYVMAAGGFFSSQTRLLLFLFPLGAVVVGAATRRRLPRPPVYLAYGVALLSFVVLQTWWILQILRPVAPDRPV